MPASVSSKISKKGWELFRTGKIKKEVETGKRIHFKVYGETEEHSVTFDKGKNKFSCDCRYFSLKQKECSHILAAKISME